MCGLAYIRHGDVDVALRAMSHRGLRSGSTSLDDVSAIGHVRLPIIGTGEENDQPIRRGDWLISFVGEILNYQDLDANAASDAQVLANLWADGGVACLDRLEGFFSFVAVNARTGEVHVITDYLAKKPLYIHLPTCSVASEVKALAHLGGALDPLFMSSTRKWGYHFGERTMLDTVRKIPPANHIVMRPEVGGYERRAWCALEPRDWVETLAHDVRRAILSRLVADVPVAILGSGGLDSSIVLQIVMAHERGEREIPVFHVENGEREYLDMLGLPDWMPVIEVKVEDADVREALYFMEGPTDLGSMLPQLALSSAIREARPEIRVVITGDGADEAFGGYRRSLEYDSQRSDVFEELVHYHVPRLDRLGMARQLEIRCPFMDRAVVEGALALPYRERMAKKWLRREFAHLLPDEIAWGAKRPLKSSQVRQGGLVWTRTIADIFEAEVFSGYF